MKKGKILTGILLVSVAALTFVACGKKTTKTNTNTKTNITTKTTIKTTNSGKTTKTNKTTKDDVVKDSSKFYKLDNGFINVNVKDGKVDSIFLINEDDKFILKPVFINDKIVAFDMYSIFADVFRHNIYDQFLINNKKDSYHDGIDMFYDGTDFVIRNASYISKYKSIEWYSDYEYKGITDIKVSDKGEISSNIKEVSLSDSNLKMTLDGFECIIDEKKIVVNYSDEFNYEILEYAIEEEGLHLLSTITSEKLSNGDVVKKECNEAMVVSPDYMQSPSLLDRSIDIPIDGPVIGIPIDNEEIESVLHFEDGKVVSIDDLLPNGHINFTLYYEYNKNGLLTKYTNISPFDDEILNTYSYDENNNLVQFISSGYEHYVFDYEYDSLNRLKKIFFESEYPYEISFEYDSNNRIISRTETDYDGDEIDYSKKSQLTYNDDFVSKEDIYIYYNGKYFLNNSFETEYNNDNTLKSKTEAYYDENVNIADGSKYEYIYDSNKKRIGSKTYTFDGRWILNKVETKVENKNITTEHIELYKAILNNDYLSHEVDIIETKDLESSRTIKKEIINKNYEIYDGAPVIVETLKDVTTYTNGETLEQYVLRDGEFKLYNLSSKTFDNSGRVLTQYNTSFDKDTLVFKFGTYTEYTYNGSGSNNEVTKKDYTYNSYDSNYAPVDMVIVKEEVAMKDYKGNYTGNRETTLYQDGNVIRYTLEELNNKILVVVNDIEYLRETIDSELIITTVIKERETVDSDLVVVSKTQDIYSLDGEIHYTNFVYLIKDGVATNSLKEKTIYVYSEESLILSGYDHYVYNDGSIDEYTISKYIIEDGNDIYIGKDVFTKESYTQYDENDLIKYKEVYCDGYVEFKDYLYEDKYILESTTFTPSYSKEKINKYYENTLDESNLYKTETITIDNSDLSTNITCKIVEYHKHKTAVNENIGYSLCITEDKNGLLLKEEKTVTFIKEINDTNVITDERLTITVYEYDESNRLTKKTIYKNEVSDENIYEIYEYSYDEEITDRIISYDYTWHVSGSTIYTGKARYYYDSDLNYEIINEISKDDSSLFESINYKYENGILVKKIIHYEDSSHYTTYTTLFDEIVEEKVNVSTTLINDKQLTSIYEEYIYDFYGNQIKTYEKRTKESYEDEVDYNNLNNNKILSRTVMITKYYNGEKILTRQTCKYNENNKMISETTINNEFNDSKYYNWHEKYWCYNEEGTTTEAIEITCSREYETDIIISGTKKVSDFTTGSETKTYYSWNSEDGEWEISEE